MSTVYDDLREMPSVQPLIDSMIRYEREQWMKAQEQLGKLLADAALGQGEIKDLPSALRESHIRLLSAIPSDAFEAEAQRALLADGEMRRHALEFIVQQTRDYLLVTVASGMRRRDALVPILMGMVVQPPYAEAIRARLPALRKRLMDNFAIWLAASVEKYPHYFRSDHGELIKYHSGVYLRARGTYKERCLDRMRAHVVSHRR